MRRYKVENLTEGRTKYYYIQDCQTYDIVPLPSKYLKYKIKANRSPNTVKRSAFSICYYLEYLNEIHMEIPQVYELDLERQNEHFVDFLYWLKAGNHTEKNNLKVIHNGTCNAYLEDVFRFFLYIEGMYEQLGSLKVLSYNYHFAVNAVGVKRDSAFRRSKVTCRKKNGTCGLRNTMKLSQSFRRVPTAGINSSSCCLRKPDSESGKFLV